MSKSMTLMMGFVMVAGLLSVPALAIPLDGDADLVVTDDVSVKDAPAVDKVYHTFDFQVQAPAPVPEPASLALAGLGGLALVARQKFFARK
jgi:hypothetical protein